MVSRRRRLVVYEEATSDSEEAPAPPKKPCQWLQSELATLANEHEKGATMSLLDRVYTPTMVIPASSLVVHSQKVSQVKDWLGKVHERARASQASLLIISGPTGCGKTCVVKSVCSELKVRIVDGYAFAQALSTDLDTRSTTVRPNANQSGYPMLCFSTPTEVKRKGAAGEEACAESQSKEAVSFGMILFDDLPNAEAAIAIANTTSVMADRALQIVLIFTDPCEGRSFATDPTFRALLKTPHTVPIVHATIYTLFLKPASPKTISFNPLANTFMKKLSQHCNVGMKYLKPGQGDARAVLLNAHMSELSRCGAAADERDQECAIIDAVRRILCARSEMPPFDPMALTEPDRERSHALLFANYPMHMQRISNASRVAEAFSTMDAVPWMVQRSDTWSQAAASIPELAIYCIARGRRGPTLDIKACSIDFPHGSGATFEASGSRYHPQRRRAADLCNLLWL